MLRWIKANFEKVVLVLLVLLVIDMTVGSWLRHNTSACLKLFYRPGGETIVDVKGLGGSGSGIRGRGIYLVTTESGARWTLHVYKIYQVTPWQIGPGGWITGIDSWLISEPPGKQN